MGGDGMHGVWVYIESDGLSIEIYHVDMKTTSPQ